MRNVVLHPGIWNATTTAVGLGTIVLAFATRAVPQLKRYALVLVVFVVTGVVWILALTLP